MNPKRGYGCVPEKAWRANDKGVGVKADGEVQHENGV